MDNKRVVSMMGWVSVLTDEVMDLWVGGVNHWMGWVIGACVCGKGRGYFVN